MGWVRIDDGFHSHPKVVAAGWEAIGFYVVALTYCNAYLTDGHVPDKWVRREAGRRTKAISQALVGAGLWERNGDGWQVHDYHDHQVSATDIKAKRKAAATRMDRLRKEPK